MRVINEQNIVHGYYFFAGLQERNGVLKMSDVYLVLLYYAGDIKRQSEQAIRGLQPYKGDVCMDSEFPLQRSDVASGKEKMDPGSLSNE